MDVLFICDACGQHLTADESLAGEVVSCPGCNQPVTVPPPAPPEHPITREDTAVDEQAELRPSRTPVPPPRPPQPSRPGGLSCQTAGGGAAAIQAILTSILSPSVADYARRLAFVWGIVLVIAFFLPVLDQVPSGAGLDLGKSAPGLLEDLQRQLQRELRKSGQQREFERPLAGANLRYRVAFPNIEGLAERGTSGTMKFLWLYPLLGGLGLILLARLTRGFARALGTLGIGFLVFIMVTAAPERRLLSMLPTVGQMMAALFSLPLLLVPLLIGLRLQEADPSRTFGRLMAGVSGSIFLLLLILPILPEPFSFPLLIPFDLMNTDVFLGLAALLTLVALATVAVIGCVTFGRNFARNRWNAWLGMWILYGTLVVAPCLFGFGFAWKECSGLGKVLVPLTGAIKFEPLIYGLLAPIVIGVIELANLLPSAKFSLAKVVEQISLPAQDYPANQASAQESAASKATPRRIGTKDHPATEAPTVPAREPRGVEDVLRMLQQLDDMRKRELITDADYEAKKNELLGKVRFE